MEVRVCEIGLGSSSSAWRRQKCTAVPLRRHMCTPCLASTPIGNLTKIFSRGPSGSGPLHFLFAELNYRLPHLYESLSWRPPCRIPNTKWIQIRICRHAKHHRRNTSARAALPTGSASLPNAYNAENSSASDGRLASNISKKLTSSMWNAQAACSNSRSPVPNSLVRGPTPVWSTPAESPASNSIPASAGKL